MDTKDKKKVVNLIKDNIAAREVFDIILKDINAIRMDMYKHSNPGATKRKTVAEFQCQAKYEAYTDLQQQLEKLREEIII